MMANIDNFSLTFANFDHPRVLKIVAIVDRWSLFRGYLYYERSKWDLKIVTFTDRWSPFRGAHYITCV